MTKSSMSFPVAPETKPYVRNMLRPSLTGETRISTLAQLIFAEEVLDDLDAQPDAEIAGAFLRARAEAYVRANPDLLSAPWLRNAGAVYDIIERVRNEFLDTAARVSNSVCKLAH